MRRLRSQGAAEGGQPHADRGGDAGWAASRAPVRRSWPQAHPRTRTQLFLVVLPHILAGQGSRAAAGSHVGIARSRRAEPRAPLCRAHAHLGTAERPRPAGDGVRPLSGHASPERRVAQAIDALRHGWPIKVGDAPVLLPVESAYASTAQSTHMLISAARAETLKLTNQRPAADGHSPVLLRAAEPLDVPHALAIADPALDSVNPLKGPFLAEPLAWLTGAKVALELARIAGVLPAFLVDPDPAGEPVMLKSVDLAAWADPQQLAIATRARLPVAAEEAAEIVIFRSPGDMREHVALVLGERSLDRVPLVRLHSECLTGDIFGSLKCDCGPQLDHALAAMAEEGRQGGWGVLLYLRQEGRGIGLVNKLRAYRLQDEGVDTLEANRRLGLPAEARDFPLAARMLDLLGVGAVRLMTNNPEKVAALEAAGVEVTQRVPHQLPANPHNARYLDTKRDKAGHLLL
ncbi:MAG: GTP cyclohydrolase II [Erythrobacter sp.]|nr:GTP cyclohydrolase II [Erythrobacter sp.]